MSEPIISTQPSTVEVPQGDDSQRAPAIGLVPEVPSDTVPAPGSLPAGEAQSPWPKVAGYEILGELGKGGMGVVYRARQIGLNRLVALKMIRGEPGTDGQPALRFHHEAESVAKLQHANIVQIHEIGMHDGLPYFSLEYVDGGSLDKHLAKQPQPPLPSAELVETLARAMHYAHRMGIVHRDLKPANVLLAADTPKITDFGIAKQMDSAVHLTQTGAIVGTPAYMAPEQVAGDPSRIGPAVDIYALGVILYEMLTGRPPFVGPNRHELYRQVIDADPLPPGKLVAGVPRDLETICLKCLRKEPSRRYADAHALAEDLRRYRAGEPIQARPVGALERTRKWVRRYPAVATLLAAIAAVAAVAFGLVTWQWREAIHANSVADMERGSKLEAVARAARQELETAVAQRKAAEGRHTQYIATLGQADRTWLANKVGTTEQLLGSCPLDLRGWEWHYLKKRNRSGHQILRADHFQVTALAMRPDGKTFATGGGHPDRADLANGVSVWETATGKLLYKLPAEEGPESMRGPISSVAIGPNGKLLAVVATRLDRLRLIQGDKAALEQIDGEMKLWDLEKRFVLQSFPGVYGQVAFSPQGVRLAATDKSGEIRIWENATSAAWNVVLTLPARLGLVKSLAFSPDGKWLASARTAFFGIANEKPQYQTELTLWDAVTGELLRKLDAPLGEINCVAFSPDGRRLASANSLDVTIWDLTAAQPPLVLPGYTASVSSIAWSADGKSLAVGSRDQTARIWDTTTGRELNTLRGHTATVASVAIPAQEEGPIRQLVTASEDGTVRIWNVPAGAGPRTLRGHAGPIAHLAYSPDGRLLASRGLGGPVKIWDVGSGKVLAQIDCRAEKVAFSLDSRFLVTAGGDLNNVDRPGELQVWDAQTGHLSRNLSGHTKYVLSVAWSPDGRRIASVSGNPGLPPRAGEVIVWDADTGEERLRFRPSLRCAGCVAYSPDSRLLAVAGMDEVVQICDAADGREIRQLRGHQSSVNVVAFSRDGTLIATGAYDGTAILWDAKGGSRLARLHAYTDPITDLSFNADGTRLATASFDFLVTNRGEVKIWETSLGNELLTLPGQSTVAFSPDGNSLAAASQHGVLQPGAVLIWDGKPCPEICSLRSEAPVLFGLACRPDGKRLAVGDVNGFVTIWNPITRREVFRWHAHEASSVTGVSFSPEGQRLATAGADGTAKIWNPESGQLLFTLTGHEKWVSCACFSPDGKHVATGSQDRTVKYWNADSGQLEFTLPIQKDTVRDLAFSPDGQSLASAGRDKIARLWDLATHSCREFAGHEEMLNGVAISSDGRLLATGSADKQAMIWDISSGQVLHHLRGHIDLIRGVAFSPNGRNLATGSGDGTVKIWDTATGKELATLHGHIALVRSVIYSPDGNWIISASFDGTVKVWDSTPWQSKLTPLKRQLEPAGQ